ncbi:hypothetical protein Q8A67_001513 [Cirrhinus molitorella]|uniref:Fibronectin type-III domain-containing protein n=1 Tax=Cirrhinus molitorella TaxID=172907 RepID=A0AA88TZS1_9TELE|nr:hypothetical protein Q8A67_001513 [Cirrhinus molitorella]
MDSVGVNLIETAGLGRPFQLGMLYDCRKDNLIAGIRFWNKEQLEQNTCPRPQINTNFSVTALDSIKDKSNLLNVEGKLNLSVLGGLVQVSGAAKYLKDTKSSFIQQRLTLHYHSTCEFKELTVNQLPSANIPEDVHDTATHIVTGILYGADACFVFDRHVSSDEDQSTVKGDAKVVLEKLKCISLDVNVELNMDDKEKNAVKNFTCTFYGDFQLPSNPTTFEDAMKVFADLPKLLKENQELAVPLSVWLYPLDKLHSRASKLHKEISMDLIQETESVLESLNTAEMKCSDLLEDSPAVAFAAFHEKILQMKQNCCKYKLRLMKKLGSLLPNICGEVINETELNDFLQEHEESPFSEGDLTEWLKERKSESEIIKTVLRQLKDYGAQVEVNIDAILMDLEIGNLVSYTFTSLNMSDMILPKQKIYLSSSPKEEKVEISPDIKQKSWLTAEIKKTMRRNLEIFKNLINSKDCKPAKFIVSSKEMKNHPGSCILLYENGSDDTVFFIPPSKPVCPVTEEVKGQSVVLKVVPPSCPATVELRLLYKPKQDTVWTSEPVLKDQHTVTLTDLREDTEYEIKCAAMGKLNFTTYSDVNHIRIIEKKLIMALDSVIDNLSFTENKCSELLKDPRTNTFSAFHKKIEDMKRFCQIYRQDFSGQSQSLIQSVQACEEETCALSNLLEAHQESPFNTQDLMEWISGKEKELNTVGEFLQQLLDFGAEVKMSLDSVLSDIKVENVVCYMFSSLEKQDELLSEQENYLKVQTTSRKKNPKSAPRTLTWLTGNIREKMREHLIIFKELMILHSSQSTKFIVSSQDHENHPGSCILLYEHGCDEAVCFSPPPKPVCPVTEEVKGQSVVLKVVPPSCPATVELRLLYKPKQDTVWTSEPVLKDQHTVTLTDLREDTEYEIKCAAMGKLYYIRESDVITVKTERNMWSIIAHNIKKNWSRKIEDGRNENLSMFKLNLNETWQNRDGFCRRSTFGKNNTKENKTIMMIGATGAGKTTLINSMINYILGVQWEDDFRFVLIDEGKQKSQAESQTSEITAYQINHMNGFRIPYSLIIVDTPGFGDTRGISQDQKITKQIQEFFSARGGINRIDAVCFVVQASLARLTDKEKYFDSILSIFGKDIAQNIIVLVTFADENTPPVLEAIKVSEVPCSTDESGEPLHFKFNNSAVFATNNKSADDEESDCENFDQMFWKMGFSSMKKFFTSLNMMKTQSLCLTQEVLKERQQLEVFLEGLQPQINAGLTKLDEIKKTRAALQQHKAEMDANKDYEYEFEVTVLKQIENNTGYYLFNCQKCYFTCYDKCVYANDSDIYKCKVIKDGKCTVCPGKCVWNVHFNQKYKWDYVKEKRKETYHELKRCFEDAHGQVMLNEKILEKLEKELHVVQGIVAELIVGSQKSLERLQDIALKPNPLSTPDYIDLMIESEKQEAKPGFQDRIQSLMEVRKKAEIIRKVSTGEVLPEDLKSLQN